MEKDCSKHNLKLIENWLNTTPEFIYLKDKNGIYQEVSKATNELAGCNMIGKSDMEIYPEDKAKMFIAQDREVIVSRRLQIYEDIVTHPSKGKMFLETIKSPIFDENGEIIGTQGISRNINMLSEKMSEQKSQLEAILDHIPVALWLKDKEGRYLMVNKEYENFYDVKKENLLNREVKETLINNNLATESTVNHLMNVDKQVMSSKDITQEEVLMNIKGEERYVEITKAPVINEKKQVIGLLGISHDVTEQRNYERLIIKSKEYAEEANRAKSDFLANMSHEIRTPMNGILGFMQLLADTDLDKEQRDFVDEAQKSSEILLALLNDILDLSKIEAGKMTMENIGFNIRYVLEDVGTLASSNASKKGVEINVLCHSDIPERVIGDPSRLKQVLNNFVNNAIKFTHDGEINITASLVSKSDKKVKLYFEIQDTGIGIAKENQAKIFEAFTQADSSTTRKYGGTGLGLAISKNIVKMMNGEIKVESQENVGSKFSFTGEFPIDNSADSAFETKKVSLKDTKILIVDDNKTNLKVVEHYLKEYRCKTVCCEDAISALSSLRDEKDHFDIILTDFCMPTIDGMEFAAMAKKLDYYHETPIILLSSRAQISDCKANDKNNLRGYLPKPIRKNDLIECIMLVLNKEQDKSKLITDHTIKEIRQNTKIKILLVEDNPLNQKLTTKMLNKAGYNCDIANNGQEAVSAYKQNDYDLIFMDCQMPVMDGYQATGEIRKLEQTNGKCTPIVALTANAMDSDFKVCLDAGMTDYLAKPLKQEHLLEKVQIYSSQIESPEDLPSEPEQNTYDSEDIKEIMDAISKDLGIDTEDAKELLDDFWKDLGTQLDSLREKIEAKDYENVRQIAHSIKGASGNLRINKIFQLTKDIEFMAKNNELSGAMNLLNQVIDYATQIQS